MKSLGKIVDGHVAANHPRVGFDSGIRGVLSVGLIEHFSDHFFQYIIQGHDTDNGSMLINDEGHVRAPSLELREQFIGCFTGRNESRWMKEFMDLSWTRGSVASTDPLSRYQSQQSFYQQDANNIVGAALPDRNATHPALSQLFDELIPGSQQVQTKNVGPRGHEF